MSIRHSLKNFSRAVARVLVKARLLPRIIILKCDGGICSQMHFRLVGEMLERRGERVVYNLDWFKSDGKDLDGRYARNFDLLKLFPDLSFSTLNNRFISDLYHYVFYFWNDYFDDKKAFDWLNFHGPLYLDGYFRDPQEMFGPMFDELFKADPALLDNANKNLYQKIESSELRGGACAIHVRRGDLAKFNPAYGNPTPIDYFTDSCRRIRENYPDADFFLFSDEPNWCREHVLPKLGVEVEICDINGSDRGYFDLLLMSRCRHHITSQGSMGRYAARLRPESRRTGMVILPPRF